MRNASHQYQYLALVVLLSVLCGCANNLGTTADVITPTDVSEPAVWGAQTNVTKLRHLYFSSQPDEEALRVARDNGVTTVINLRESGEMDWNEEAAVVQLGLNYRSIPIRREGRSLDPAAVQAIDKAVMAQAGEPVLLHCSSSNRAAAWLAVHLVTAHDIEESESLQVAERAGLTYEPLIERVQTYLRNQ